MTPQAIARFFCVPAISMALDRAFVMTTPKYNCNITSNTNVFEEHGLITCVMSDICTRLKEERELAGLKQPELARLAGVSQGSVSHWENGTRRNPRALLKLAAALNLRPEYLQDGHLPKRPSANLPTLRVADTTAELYPPLPSWPFKSVSPKDWGSLPAARRADIEDHITMMVKKHGMSAEKTAA